MDDQAVNRSVWLLGSGFLPIVFPSPFVQGEWWTDWGKEPRKREERIKAKVDKQGRRRWKEKKEMNETAVGNTRVEDMVIMFQFRAAPFPPLTFYFTCSAAASIHTHTHNYSAKIVWCVCVLVHSRAKGELLKYQDKACPQLDPFILLLLWLPLKKRERCSCCWCCLPISPSLSRYVSLFLVFVSWPSPSHWPRNERQPQQLLTSLNR